ncbi:unnamed protein product [Effrenium voratum]|uniref:Calcium-dependent protein kinase n=1 Tax=Effrenium voratum TaxID=2562239 RepID=A0AA36NKQ1_9DINO|nr:unnamed protein product [Effrenium voratum]
MGCSPCQGLGCAEFFRPTAGRRSSIADTYLWRRAANPMAAASRYHQNSHRHRLEEDYTLQDKILGFGMSGSVQLVKSTVDGRDYALKTYDKNTMDERRYELLRQEVEIYLSVDHPNIAQLSDVYEWDDGIALIMEYCSGGELSTRGLEDEKDVAQATKQMLHAVNYLHAHHIVHRDLKLENFLYESSEKSSLLKLIDFGLSFTLDGAEMTMKATVGTLLYCSPEVVSAKEYTSKCDLWSLGVIVFMLLSGRPPFLMSQGQDRLSKNICRGKIEWDRLDASLDASDFVQKLLAVNPEKRLDAPSALEHPWLTKKVAQDKPQLGRDVLISLKQYTEQSKIQRVLLQLLAQELGPEDVKEMRELFLKIDSDERGTIRLCDLKAAMQRRASQDNRGMFQQRRCTSPNLSPTNLSEKQVEKLFSVLDANGDQEVHYSDFLAATVSMRGQLRRESLRKIFNRIDSNRNGAISKEEVQRIVGALCDEAQAAEFLQEANVPLNSHGEITFEAFAQLFERADVVPDVPTPVKLPVRQDLLKACAWEDSPGPTRRSRRFTRSESVP